MADTSSAAASDAPPRRAHGRRTISFCVATRGSAARVRALLELMRPHVDEIVLSVQTGSGGFETLEACQGLADQALVHSLADGSPSQLPAWLLHRCSGDWILRLDDDELPSAALLAALPELANDRRSACAIALKRRWLFPDPHHWISGFPWGGEPQTRLLRNLPSLWTFSGANHTEGEFHADRSLQDLPIYHLDLLLRTEEQRRAKRDWYENLVPDLDWETFALNDMYLPEAYGPATEAVPEADRPAIQSLLDPAPTPGSAGNREADGAVGVTGPRVTSMHEVIKHNAARELPPDSYLATLEFLRPREELITRTASWFELMVENLGTSPWPWGDVPPLIRIGTRWLTADGQPVSMAAQRTLFRETIWPSVPTLVPLLVETPAIPGDYVLEADLVHEGIKWFGCQVQTAVAVAGRRARERAERDALLREARRAQAIAATKRYRFAVGVARPLDWARGLRDRDRGSGPDGELPAAAAAPPPSNGRAPVLHPYLESIYETGNVTGADGVTRPYFPASISREEALVLAQTARSEGSRATLETGMAYGLSTLAIAGIHAERGGGDHIAIDPTLSVWASIGELNVQRAGLEEYVRVIEAPSEAALPSLLAEGCRRDFVFIDGSHLFENVLLDFFYADRLLDPNGIVAFHDTWMPAVTRVLEFVLSNRAYDQVNALPGTVAVLRKRRDDRRPWDHYVE